MKRKIGIIGLGYVGLPLAVSFAKEGTQVIGFDIDSKKILELRKGNDVTGEVQASELNLPFLQITDDEKELSQADFYVVTVPTPVDNSNRPDLSALKSASQTIGRYLNPKDIVVFESTVYPGVTEDFCGSIIEKVSGLRRGVDFKLGYSPERINPGDRLHRLDNVVKVVSGEDSESLEIIATVYAEVAKAGVFKAKSIQVAEAAKVLENTQRDINIALMNELAIIMEKLNIRTHDVLEAARTKWNFLNFQPGLVGGHCIGVDPYYLTHKAEEMGYNPQVVLAGRRINDSMGKYIAEQTIKKAIMAGKSLEKSRFAIFGLTFKENVPDLRNSRVPDIVNELTAYGIHPTIIDPRASKKESIEMYNIDVLNNFNDSKFDVIILAVAHEEFRAMGVSGLKMLLNHSGLLVDVKSTFSPSDFAPHYHYWSL